MSILDEIVEASEVVESVNIVIYGASGTGKTTLAGSGRNQGKDVLILAVEDGVTSIAAKDNHTQVLKIDSWEKLDEAINFIEQNPDKWEWVVLDSASHLQTQIIWPHILDSAVSRNPSRSRYRKELQEYDRARNMFQDVIDRLFTSDANIIAIAGDERDEDEEGEVFCRPRIQGQKGALAAWFAERAMMVGYLSIGRAKSKAGKVVKVRKLDFQKSEKVVAKDRTGTFKKPLINPTLEGITKALIETSETHKGSE